MPSDSPMIPFDDALRIALEHVRPVGTERVSLAVAGGRVLAESIRADHDIPPFDKSAMDGFACRREDLGRPLTIIETIPAGATPRRHVGAGQCARIMTGAPVPAGADTVFMVEVSEALGGDRVRFTGAETKPNIIPRAEDVRAGDRLLEAGIRLRPDHVAVLASAGIPEPLVGRRPRVGIIATGDELVEPAVAPGPSQIRNSNSHQLVAQVQAAGGEPIYFGIAGDQQDLLEATFRKAAAECDVLLLSGGVSQGDFDLVPDVMRAQGVEILFDRIRVKPGKPTTFGVGEDLAVFGLPGNPVSTFVIFEVLVRPFLLATAGMAQALEEWTTRLDVAIRRRQDDRDEWLPVRRTEDGGVAPVPYHGSAHFLALAGADGLTMVPAGTLHIPEGTRIRVRPLPT
ncbi:MAG: gephyrin-like molybdotransferase Glp [Pseudomonadota bacterium]